MRFRHSDNVLYIRNDYNNDLYYDDLYYVSELDYDSEDMPALISE